MKLQDLATARMNCADFSNFALTGHCRLLMFLPQEGICYGEESVRYKESVVRLSVCIKFLLGCAAISSLLFSAAAAQESPLTVRSGDHAAHVFPTVSLAPGLPADTGPLLYNYNGGPACRRRSLRLVFGLSSPALMLPRHHIFNPEESASVQVLWTSHGSVTFVTDLPVRDAINFSSSCDAIALSPSAAVPPFHAEFNATFAPT